MVPRNTVLLLDKRAPWYIYLVPGRQSRNKIGRRVCVVKIQPALTSVLAYMGCWLPTPSSSIRVRFELHCCCRRRCCCRCRCRCRCRCSWCCCSSVRVLVSTKRVCTRSDGRPTLSPDPSPSSFACGDRTEQASEPLCLNQYIVSAGFSLTGWEPSVVAANVVRINPPPFPSLPWKRRRRREKMGRDTSSSSIIIDDSQQQYQVSVRVWMFGQQLAGEAGEQERT